jgi:carbonic anhydrase/acetyltransferase-like protein (isoleucine patch superfamily)
MILEHAGNQPNIHESAYVAPNAVVCGDVTVGANSRILFGAVLTAEGGPVVVGNSSIVMENAVVRSTRKHPVRIGDHVLVGPRAYLTGCSVEDNVFLATGTTVFNGARLGAGTEVRINALVHLKTVLLPNSVVPIGWIAVGDPAQLRPPHEHKEIWQVQEALDFPREVFGLKRQPAAQLMPQLTERYAAALARHQTDRML